MHKDIIRCDPMLCAIIVSEDIDGFLNAELDAGFVIAFVRQIANLRQKIQKLKQFYLRRTMPLLCAMSRCSVRRSDIMRL